MWIEKKGGWRIKRGLLAYIPYAIRHNEMTACRYQYNVPVSQTFNSLCEFLANLKFLGARGLFYRKQPNTAID